MFFTSRIISVVGKLRQANKTIFSDKYLFVTNVVISASLSGVGDAIEQRLVARRKGGENSDEFDNVRNRNMCISGIAVGILTHKWYRWLDTRYPGRSLKIVMNKVLLDTLIFSPLQIVTFFCSMGILENSSIQDVKKEICDKGKILYLFEWMAWAPMQVANFYFLPSKYRVLFDNAFSLVYDIFVSYVKFDRPDPTAMNSNTTLISIEEISRDEMATKSKDK